MINEIAAATSQYTGAEIELIVKESVWRAFNRYKKDNKNEITFEDLLGAKETIIPIADSYKEKINFLEQWARTRAQYASKKTSMPVGTSTSIRKLVDKI